MPCFAFAGVGEEGRTWSEPVPGKIPAAVAAVPVAAAALLPRSMDFSRRERLRIVSA